VKNLKFDNVPSHYKVTYRVAPKMAPFFGGHPVEFWKFSAVLKFLQFVWNNCGFSRSLVISNIVILIGNTHLL